MIYKDGKSGNTMMKRFPVTSITRNKEYKLTKSDPTHFFPKRHLGNKSDSKGYLNWEHSLIPTIKKWGCKNPWVSANQKNLSKVQHSLHKIYKNF